jgi:hypothetical protein
MSLLSKASDAARPGAREILPVGSLVLLVVGLVASGAPAQAPSFDKAMTWANSLSGVGLGLLVLVIIGASIVLQPVIVAVGAALQGRMSAPVLRWIGRELAWRKKRRRRHARARLHELSYRIERGETLDEAGRAELEMLAERVRRYPATGHVRPTVLGNVIAAGEEDAGRPYGLDARLALPRLELLLPESAATLLSSRGDDLGFAVRFCSTLSLAAVASAALIGEHLASRAALIPVLAAAFAWLSYRNAVAAATAYAEALRVVFDLHRFLLYEALRRPLPQDLDNEREEAERIMHLLGSGVAASWQYVHPVAGPET